MIDTKRTSFLNRILSKSKYIRNWFLLIFLSRVEGYGPLLFRKDNLWNCARRRGGFTLIELLVVIGIIGC